MIEIYNEDETLEDELALFTSALIRDIAENSRNNFRGIVGGLEVATTGGSNREASVSAGFISWQVTGTITTEACIINFDENTSNLDRIDIVEVDSLGEVSIVKGTPANEPKEPERSVLGAGQASKIKLASVLVKDGDAVLPSSQFLDRRFFSTSITVAEVTTDPTGMGWNSVVFNSSEGTAWNITFPYTSPSLVASFNGGLTIGEKHWDLENDEIPVTVNPQSVILRRKYGYSVRDVNGGI